MSKDCEHKTADVLIDYHGVTVADCTYGCGKRLIVGQPFDDDWQAVNEEFKRLHGVWLFMSPDVPK
jgi:hypothetical protein